MTVFDLSLLLFSDTISLSSTMSREGLAHLLPDCAFFLAKEEP